MIGISISISPGGAKPGAAAPAFDPETASAIVAGAGTGVVNVTYLPAGTLNDRGRYETGAGQIINWADGAWYISDDTEIGGAAYFSGDDVAFPWLATTWEAADGALPVPTVTHS